MYIAIEGLKGTGKSTILNLLRKKMEDAMILFQVFSPTAPMPENNWMEVLHAWFPVLRSFDPWCELLYAARANHAAKQIDWCGQLIIGDRSIVTSYVTRWFKWNEPIQCIDRVNRLQKTVPGPDVVIYLSLDLSRIIKRIQIRKRNYGKDHEKPQVLAATQSIYNEVRKHRKKIHKLAHTKWITINANKSSAEIADQIFNQIIKLTKSNEYESVYHN